MSTPINQEDFKSLVKEDKLFGHGKTFEIDIANCGGPGRHPTHLVFTKRNDGKDKDYDYIFHDGENIRYSADNDKERDGALVGELIGESGCRIIKRSESVKNAIRKSNLSFIGTGNYCPECGGLCGNSNHTSRKW